MTTHHFRAAATAACLTAALVSGCGSSTSADQVASIPTHAADTTQTPSTDSTSGTTQTPAGRPVFRLDDTDARRTALINAWSQCLIDHGATRSTGRDMPGVAGAGKSDMIVVADPVPPKASAACESKLPELPPETEAETNPHFHDQSLAYVDCMKDKGLWVQLLNNHDLDWTFTDGHPVPVDDDKIEHTCLLQAFGGK
jgi:hypothetical protein